MSALLAKIQRAICDEMPMDIGLRDCARAASAALAIAGPAIRERCAAYVDCGCPHGPEAVQAAKQFGRNSARRWNICAESICAALEAHEIRSMTDE